MLSGEARLAHIKRTGAGVFYETATNYKAVTSHK